MTAGTFAAGCFGALASLYVRDVLHRGPVVLGMIGLLARGRDARPVRPSCADAGAIHGN